MQWADKSDWRDALLRGWRDAVVADPKSAGDAWVLALLAAWPAKVLGTDHSSVQALLPLDKREHIWAVRLGRQDGAMADLAREILAACRLDDRLSPQFAVNLARELATELTQIAPGWGGFWHQTAPALACLMPASGLSILAQAPRGAQATPQVSDTLAQIDLIVELRQALSELPTAPGSR
jgi:hypothetical protein